MCFILPGEHNCKSAIQANASRYAVSITGTHYKNTWWCMHEGRHWQKRKSTDVKYCLRGVAIPNAAQLRPWCRNLWSPSQFLLITANSFLYVEETTQPERHSILLSYLPIPRTKYVIALQTTKSMYHFFNSTYGVTTLIHTPLGYLGWSRPDLGRRTLRTRHGPCPVGSRRGRWSRGAARIWRCGARTTTGSRSRCGARGGQARRRRGRGRGRRGRRPWRSATGTGGEFKKATEGGGTFLLRCGCDRAGAMRREGDRRG